MLYILELTLGFETYIQVNSIRKANKYTKLIKELSSIFTKATFLYLSMGALGIMGSFCDSFPSLLEDLNLKNMYGKELL